MRGGFRDGCCVPACSLPYDHEAPQYKPRPQSIPLFPSSLGRVGARGLTDIAVVSCPLPRVAGTKPD
ncbi:hypothetical protein IG631_12673 [Alternaria alternata]|nr:hypothetical protein IG631_12673 [Alternaria alternata]